MSVPDPTADDAPNPGGTRRPVTRVEGETAVLKQDWLAVEEPLELRVNGEELLVLMRTPGQDEALAYGFALSEGVAEEADHIRSLRRPSGREGPMENVIDMLVEPSDWDEIQAARRALFASTSCGLCGKTSIASVRLSTKPLDAPPVVPHETVVSGPSQLRSAQPLFKLSGGLHAAALLTKQGELLAIAEDVGRHNACDKLFGRCVLDEGLPWPLRDQILVVSGRASFEILQKARMVGLGAVVAVSAPSSLAVDFARELNMTLVGFCRKESYVVYSGAVSPAI